MKQSSLFPKWWRGDARPHHPPRRARRTTSPYHYRGSALTPAARHSATPGRCLYRSVGPLTYRPKTERSPLRHRSVTCPWKKFCHPGGTCPYSHSRLDHAITDASYALLPHSTPRTCCQNVTRCHVKDCSGNCQRKNHMFSTGKPPHKRTSPGRLTISRSNTDRIGYPTESSCGTWDTPSARGRSGD